MVDTRTMRSLVFFLVLVLLAGCGSLKGCSGSTPVATATPAATPTVAEPLKVPEPPEARFAQKYLVIAHTSPDPGEGEDIVEKLRAAGLGEGVQRLSTTPFTALRPCLEVVVAGVFADKAAAAERSRRLAAAGVESYLKNAGALVQDREGREADCRQQAEARAAAAARALSAQGPFLVESRGERTFLLMEHGQRVADVPSPGLSQVGEDRGFWLAPLKEDPTGVLEKGARYDVYDTSGQVKEGCQVKGFALLNRGRPHFGYFQREEAPEGPECGENWLVAELDCSIGEAGSDSVVFALATGRPEPRYFHREELPESLREAQKSAVRALPEFMKLREEGQAHAEKQELPLQEELTLHVHPLEGRQLVVGLARLWTGKGNTLCGGEDFAASVSRVVAVGPNEEVTEVGGGLDAEHIKAVVDLEGDGQVELLTRHGDSVAVVDEDGTYRVSSDMPNCDCGC